MVKTIRSKAEKQITNTVLEYTSRCPWRVPLPKLNETAVSFRSLDSSTYTISKGIKIHGRNCLVHTQNFTPLWMGVLGSTNAQFKLKCLQIKLWYAIKIRVLIYIWWIMPRDQSRVGKEFLVNLQLWSAHFPFSKVSRPEPTKTRAWLTKKPLSDSSLSCSRANAGLAVAPLWLIS